MNITPKQDAFARAYVETGCQATAYRRAYDAGDMKEQTIWRKAHDVVQNGKVAARIAQLQERALKRHDITIDSITEMLVEDRKLARDLETPAAAVAAVMGLAKLHGLIVDKSKNEHTGIDGAPLIPEINVTISEA